VSKLSLAEIVAASRVVSLRDAVADGLAERLDVPVLRHIGKLDISDVMAGETLSAPSIHVAVTKFLSEAPASGVEDLRVHLTAYVVAEDAMVEGRAVYRDEIGYALALATLAVIKDEKVSRWGLEDIDYPEDAQAAPLFTARSFAKGVAYYSVTWRQTLFNLTPPYDIAGDNAWSDAP